MAIEPGHEQHQSGEFIESHVRDYSAFIQMFKWGAILTFIIAILMMIIISS